MPEGVVAHVEVFAQLRPGAATRPAGGGAAAIRGGAIAVAWEVAYPGDRGGIVPAWELPDGEAYSPPQFHFVVRVRGRDFGSGGGSGYLRMLDVVELQVKDLDASALIDRRGQVRLADGSVQQVRVAANGRVTLHGVAPGPIELELDDYPEEF